MKTILLTELGRLDLVSSAQSLTRTDVVVI